MRDSFKIEGTFRDFATCRTGEAALEGETMALLSVGWDEDAMLGEMVDAGAETDDDVRDMDFDILRMVGRRVRVTVEAIDG